MRVISRLDIKQNILIKSIMFDGVRKLGEPKEFAKLYYESNIDELMLINNTGTLYNTKLDNNLIKEIRKNKAIPISTGGGINCMADAIDLIENGSDKIVINSLIHRNFHEAKKIVETLGSASVVGAIQFEKREGNFISLCEMARETTDLSVRETLKKYEDLGVGEVLLTDVTRDGCYSGLTREILDLIYEFNNKMPILLSGGFKNKNELDFYKEIISGIVISSAFHYKKISVSEVVQYRNTIIN
tara:strand:+ start:5087 stop:5818 length:732 start_codon:yes stop_codon:yes gene_type:complete